MVPSQFAQSLHATSEKRGGNTGGGPASSGPLSITPVSGGPLSTSTIASGKPVSGGSTSSSSSGQPRRKSKASANWRPTRALPAAHPAQAVIRLFEICWRGLLDGALEIGDAIIRPIEQHGDQLPAFLPVQAQDLLVDVVVRRREDQDLVLERGHLTRRLTALE